MSNIRLRQEVWENDKYYHLAKEGSLDLNHPGMRILQKVSKETKNIVDLGCGEGTRLNQLLTKGQSGTGIDISQKALEIGRENYPHIRFIKANLEKIPLPSNGFDLVFSAYVLEHLINPIKVLEEAVRLVSPGGKLILIAPNYGAPNRASPPFKGSRVKKLIEGLTNDFVNLIIKRNMNWKKVEPIANSKNYDVDWDTTIEPYLGSLLNYIESLKLKVVYHSSCWSQELPQVKIQQKIFGLLGKAGFYPFNLWGPHLIMVAKKEI